MSYVPANAEGWCMSPITKAMRSPSGDQAGDIAERPSSPAWVSCVTPPDMGSIRTISAPSSAGIPRPLAIATMAFDESATGGEEARSIADRKARETKARETIAKPATATARASSATAIRRPGLGSEGSGRDLRLVISHQRSGGVNPSTSRRPSFSSSIVVLQEVSQTTTASVEVHPGGRRAHPQSCRDLSHRQVCVLMEDDRRTLIARELAEKRHEVARPQLAGIGHIRELALHPSSSLELGCGDAEGDPPDPRKRIGKCIAAAEGLSEGLSDRVACH